MTSSAGSTYDAFLTNGQKDGQIDGETDTGRRLAPRLRIASRDKTRAGKNTGFLQSRFLPVLTLSRDAMRKRGASRRPVSVCPSGLGFNLHITGGDTI